MDSSDLSLKAEDLGSRARTAVLWRCVSHGCALGLQMVVSIVLARLLMPKDFGIVAMALVAGGLVSLFSSLGMEQALVQRKDLKPAHLASAFWGSLLLAAVLCVLLVVLALHVAAFFKEPRMAPVLQVISLSLLIAPFGVLPRSLLQRQLDFRRRFVADMLGNLAYAGVGIGMALKGYGYWSLAGAQLASSFVATVSICAITGYLSPLRPSLESFKDLAGFGVGVTGTNLFSYMAQQIDYLVVGRWLTAEALGLYTRAFTLAHFPLAGVSAALFPVLLPTFVHLQDDPVRAREMFSKTITAIAYAAFPMLALLGVSAPELVPFVFGPQWIGAVVPTQIMCLAGMMRAINNPAGALVLAFGKAWGCALRQAFYLLSLAAAAWVGVGFGITGVAWAVIAASLVFLVAMAHLVFSCCGFPAASYPSSLRGATFVALCVLVASIVVRRLAVSAGLPTLLVLLSTLSAGTVTTVLAAVYGPFKDWRGIWKWASGRLAQ